MKKLLLSIFAVFYLAISSGFTLQVHYCMDKLSGWELSLITDNKPSCERCGMQIDKENKCCKDEQKVVKFESDQKVHQHQNFVFQQVAIIQNLPEFNFSVASLNSSFNFSVNFQEKPPNLSMPLFMRHQNFRI